MKLFIRTSLFAVAFIVALVLLLKHEPDDHACIWTILEDDILSVEVMSKTASYRLVSQNGTWSISQETETWEADPTQIKAWLNPLLHLHPKSILGGPDSDITDYARYGLQPAQATITIELNSNKREQLLIGSRSPLKDNYFIQRSGQPHIYLISTYDLDELMKTKLNRLKKKEPKTSTSS